MKEKNEQSLRDPWDTIKHTNIGRVPKGEEREKGTERIFKEIMAKKLSKFGKS